MPSQIRAQQNTITFPSHLKPRIKLAETRTANGATIALYEHDGAYAINCNGQELMHSKASASETLLGKCGTAHLQSDSSNRVLIGGLGLGFTLRAVLENAPPQTTIEVFELIPEVIDWNRDLLQSLNGSCLDDPRVTLYPSDVTATLRKAEPEAYDSILLDIDNGPIAMVDKNNASLYSKSGVRTIRSALKQKGRAIFWSAGPDQAFHQRLTQAGFTVEAIPAKVHPGAKRAAYILYQATK